MLKRKMYDRLVAWSREDDRKALLLLGARQTGSSVRAGVLRWLHRG